MGLSSAGSRGLLWAPVDVLVRISADGRTPGDPVQGPSPGRLNYWLWCGGLTGRCGAVTRYADGPLRRRGSFGLERRWAAKAGTVLSAGADVRGWEIAWGGSSEPGAAVSTEC
jgi:hypothetical protein